MLITVHDVTEMMRVWCSLCPCHGLWFMEAYGARKSGDGAAVRRHQAMSRLLDGRHGWKTCPMACKRAPELACGDFSAF